MKLNYKESGVDIGESQDLAEEKIVDDVSIEDDAHRDSTTEKSPISEDINFSTPSEKDETEDTTIKNH